MVSIGLGYCPHMSQIYAVIKEAKSIVNLLFLNCHVKSLILKCRPNQFRSQPQNSYRLVAVVPTMQSGIKLRVVTGRAVRMR